MLTAPIPLIQCLESVKVVWNCSDGCLVHLGGLKLKKSTLGEGDLSTLVQLGEGGLCHNFCE